MEEVGGTWAEMMETPEESGKRVNTGCRAAGGEDKIEAAAADSNAPGGGGGMGGTLDTGEGQLGGKKT